MSRDISTITLAMQSLRVVQRALARSSAPPMMGDVADLLRRHFEISRATAYRYVRAAYDTECVSYDRAEYRARSGEKAAERRADYRKASA